jgi:hypothetical protein
MIVKQAVERQIKSIYRLVQFQRSLRLLLRSAWIILLVYSGCMLIIIATGQHQVEKYLLGLGLLLIIFIPMLYFFSKRKLSDFVWLLDRRLGLKEQVSAAWEALDNQASHPVAVLLFEDVSRLLTNAYQSVRNKGWYIQKDLLLALIFGIIAFCISIYSSLMLKGCCLTISTLLRCLRFKRNHPMRMFFQKECSVIMKMKGGMKTMITAATRNKRKRNN